MALLDKILFGRRLIYKQDAQKAAEQLDERDFRMMRFSSAETCRCQCADVLNNAKSLHFSLKDCTENGRDAWLGIKDDIIVSVACTSQGKAADYFFTLTEKQAAISRCETHPDYRGNGLYARSLKAVMNELAKAGVEAFYIDCYAWNWPSVRGIEKAGFELIGYGWDKKGKLIFKPLKYLPVH